MRKMPTRYLVIYLIILTLAVFLISLVLLNWDRLRSELNSAKPTESASATAERANQQQTLRLAALTKFKSTQTVFAKAQASSYSLYIDEKLIGVLTENELAELEQLVGGSYQPFVADVVTLNSDEYPANAVLIVPFAKAEIALKALEVDGQVLYDPDYKLELKLARELTPSELGLASEAPLSFELAEVNRFFFAGEIIPARAVDRLFLNQTNNYTFLFDRFRQDIQTADLAFALLENPIAGDPKPCTGCTTFVGDARNAQGFKQVGFDLLGFGNHAGDGGLKSIQASEELLSEQGIGFTGVSSKNLDDAARLVVREVSSKSGGARKIGFIAADDVAWFYWAGSNNWGTNRFSTRASNGQFSLDHERIKKVISEAKAQVDYLVIMQSWGVEYTDTANAHQTAMAHAFVDAGADFVVASHPHWVQNFEIYQGKPIFYSLGNFVFDQTHTDPTRQGIVVDAYYYGGELKSLAIRAHLSCGYHQTGNNLANKVISGELSYEAVDALPEKQGCIYWQPKPLTPEHPVYQQVWSRFTKSTKIPTSAKWNSTG